MRLINAIKRVESSQYYCKDKNCLHNNNAKPHFLGINFFC